MPVHLLVAPPGAGKTQYLIEQVRQSTKEGKRVWWVGLPNQRQFVYRRATQEGALLGLEFLVGQQVYYRLLATALQLRPILIGTGRMALVGEALAELRQDLPAPGEARLFTAAIAEAKRYGLGYKDVQVRDEETRRFKDVFRLYENLNANSWDYDDFRQAALELAERGEARPEADLIIVDGFREMGPLEIQLYQTLASAPAYSDKTQKVDVWLSLPEAPPTMRASLTLEPKGYTNCSTYHAANPVTESRWVLRSLKAALANRYDALELAVVLPERHIKAFLSLADEYGVPLMDETPKALGDTVAGRLLLDLLELPDYPTASKLLALPELHFVANAALDKGVAGPLALEALAKELGLIDPWRRWLERLDLQASGDELRWAEDMLETTLPEVRQEIRSNPGFDWKRFKNHAMERAKEASSIAKGSSFRAWWAALLKETQVFDPPNGGVALLTLKQASGRRFKRVYLMHATEGAYNLGEREDYFIPEEARKPLGHIFSSLALPKRFLGRNRLLFEELRTRADELIITFPEADQGGPLVPELKLVDPTKAKPLPILPAASRLELAQGKSFEAQLENLNFGRISVQKLMRYNDCAFRHWAEGRISDNTSPPRWLALINAMRDYEQLSPARLETLKADFPEYAHWLNEYKEAFRRLRFGVRLPDEAKGAFAYLDAAARRGNEAQLYRFVEPESLPTLEAAKTHLDKRWNELWAAGYMLSTYKQITAVRVFIWPVLGEAFDVYEGSIEYIWRRIAARQTKVETAYKRFESGAVTPSPGFHCRDCRIYDLCRKGTR